MSGGVCTVCAAPCCLAVSCRFFLVAECHRWYRHTCNTKALDLITRPMNAILIPNTPTIYCMFCRHNFKKECFDRSYQTLFKSWNLSISSPKPKKWHNWNLFLFCHLKMFCWTWRSGCTALKKRPPFLPAEHSTPSETSTQSMNESYLWFYTLKVFTALLAFHSDSFRSHVWLKVKETTKHKTFPGMGGGGGGVCFSDEGA